MEIQIVPPPPRDPATEPTINKVNPGTGSTAGGYTVELDQVLETFK